MKFVVAVIFVLLTDANGAKSTSFYEHVDPKNLDQLFIIMRHGIRGPYSTYPKNPNNATQWPLGGEQLTRLGIEQVLNMGKLVANRYKSFFESLHPCKQIFLRSSAVQRCHETIQLMYKSIFPIFCHNPIDQADISPVISLPIESDSVLSPKPICPRAHQEIKLNMHKLPALAYLNKPEIKNLIKYMSSSTGLKPTLKNALLAFDIARCEEINGLDVPRWATFNNTYNKLEDLYTQIFNIIYGSITSQRLQAGPLLQELIDKINVYNYSDVEASRILIYVTHDSKIAALIKALGEPLLQHPNFASTILIEVYRRPGENEKNIRLFHIYQTLRVPYTIKELSLARCRNSKYDPCLLSKWKESLRLMLNVNWNLECKLLNEK